MNNKYSKIIVVLLLLGALAILVLNLVPELEALLHRLTGWN